MTDDPYGFMVGEAADAIRSAWGEEIEIDSVELGRHDLGEAWVTEAGSRAAAKYVIHVAAMTRRHGTSDEILMRATKSALLVAESRRITSLAFSALGTGRAQHAPDDAGRVIGSALRKHLEGLEGPSPVKDVVFVVLDRTTLLSFEKGLAAALPEFEEDPPLQDSRANS